MKKNYIAPELEKVTLNTADIMQTSGGQNELPAGVSLGTWGGSDGGMTLGGENFGWGME